MDGAGYHTDLGCGSFGSEHVDRKEFTSSHAVLRVSKVRFLDLERGRIGADGLPWVLLDAAPLGERRAGPAARASAPAEAGRTHADRTRPGRAVGRSPRRRRPA